MDPVFTLQWPEFLLADRLQKLLPKSQGYSVLVPVSRQEKGIDLAVIKKTANGDSRVITIQIKASRTYTPEKPKKETTQRYRFYTWFNRFEVPEEADFILLFGMYAPDSSKTTKVSANWYKDCTLVFTHEEMKIFFASCLTANGQPDRMFNFGFDNTSKIVQTRGGKDRQHTDFSNFLLEKRIELFKEKLDA